MKKLLLHAAVLALVASPAMAQPRHEGNRPEGQQHDMGNPPRHRAPNQGRPHSDRGPDRQSDRQSDHRSDRQSDHRPDRRPSQRPRAARPHHEWNTWRSQNRNYFNRPARRFHAPRYHRPSGWYYRRWSFGDILPSLFWSSPYWINNYGVYALPPPPPGAMWVRYGDDAILIDRFSGEVIDVIYGVFY